MQSYKQQEPIYSLGQPCTEFGIIAEGTVKATSHNHSITLQRGDVVGIFDLTSEARICTYIADTDVTIIPYAYGSPEGLSNFLEAHADLRKLILNSLNNHVCEVFDIYSHVYSSVEDLYKYVLATKTRYQTTCKIMHYTPKSLPFFDELALNSVSNELGFWMRDYYNGLHDILNTTTVEISATFAYGFIYKATDDLSFVMSLHNKLKEMHTLLSSYLLNEDYVDLYEIYTDLFKRASANGDDTSALSNVISGLKERIKSNEYIDPALIETRVKDVIVQTDFVPVSQQSGVDLAIMQAKLANSVNEILDFADTVTTTASEFKKCLEQFKALPDIDSTDSETNELRKKLVHLFNVIYSDAIQIALTKEDIPTIVKMFINFGFVDMDLFGKDNSIKLYNLCESYKGRPDKGIYTILEWFQAIWDGRKQPSRNEFDLDYPGHIRNLIKEGQISKDAEAKMLVDPHEKIVYELNNMFPSVNKITFGRIFTFCPLLAESNMIRPMEDVLLTPNKILDVVEKLNTIDYSIFYHEYTFEDLKVGVKDTIRKDILPDFILFPNIGTRGVMWQEIEGHNRRTPSRMMLSAFFVENLEKAMLKMFGEYRWEMCKREMGSRWNDFTSHSLTSDYCDYVQFFAKNRDLSAEAKEKLKEVIKRCKNSTKDVFVTDYMQFIMYESSGSSRLNRVARQILFAYCPFGKANREIVGKNTAFEECLSKHHIQSGQALHRLDIIETKYRNAGKSLPEELTDQRELLER